MLNLAIDIARNDPTREDGISGYDAFDHELWEALRAKVRGMAGK